MDDSQRPLVWGNMVAMGVKGRGLCMEHVGSVGILRHGVGGAAVEGDSGTLLEGEEILSIFFSFMVIAFCALSKEIFACSKFVKTVFHVFFQKV